MITVSAYAGWAPMPRVAVEVLSTSSAASKLEVWRVHQNGERFKVVTAGPAVIIGSWSGFDYQVPFNETVQYIAFSEDEASTATPAAWVTLPSEVPWLVHSTDPLKSMMLDKIMGPPKDFGYKSTAQEFRVLNQARAIYMASGPRAAQTGEVEFRFAAGEMARVVDLFADSGPLWLATPWPLDYGSRWIQPGDVTISNPYGYLGHPHRRCTVPYVECAQPDSDAKAVWTYDQLKARGYGSYNAMAPKFATYRDLRLDNHA